MTRKISFIIPLICFFILAGYFMANLLKAPQILPNMLEGQTAPAFSLPPIEGRDDIGFRSTDLIGNVSIVNVFGSWCQGCLVEHPFLMKLKKSNILDIHGINWREPDRLSGPAWLKRFGDPYTRIGDDPKSIAAISFGVTGAPESFLIDKKGFIRHKVVGPITESTWNSALLPLIEKLKKLD